MVDGAGIEGEFPGDLQGGESLFFQGFYLTEELVIDHWGSSMMVLSIFFTDCISPLPDGGLAVVPVEGFPVSLYAEGIRRLVIHSPYRSFGVANNRDGSYAILAPA
jgi:hypothetical protein